VKSREEEIVIGFSSERYIFYHGATPPVRQALLIIEDS
jgi:hypothetical protein